MIEAALKDTRGRVSGPSGAAAKLGTPRSTLESKIRSLKIDKNRFKNSTVEQARLDFEPRVSSVERRSEP